MRIAFAATLVATAIAVPDFQHNWSAAASEALDGNISGVRPGITLYNYYYHQDY